MSNYNKKRGDIIWSLVQRISLRSGFIAKRFEVAGAVATYAMWLKARGLSDTKLFASREPMWKSVFDRLQKGPWTVLEFGVAAGAASKYWLSEIPNPDLRWHGFDVFTGLPEAWMRGGVEFAEEGAFDAGGKTPDIDDTRATWHVGLVDDTLPKLDFDGDGPVCVLLDFDLYGPTSFALNWLAGRLKPGDVLYFDEAYDPWHERRALDEFLDAGHKVKPLGSTGIALLLEYQGYEALTP